MRPARAALALLALVTLQAAFGIASVAAKSDKYAKKETYGPPLDGQCSGTPLCYPKYTPPQYMEPRYECPAGFLLTQYLGNLQCVKKSATCPKGTTIFNGKCCSPCPAGCVQVNGYCQAAPQTVCYESINTCPDDCKQTQVCDDGRRRLMGALKNLIGEHKNKDKASHPIAIKEEKVKYAPANCRYQCCKTSTPTFPQECAAPSYDVETCPPTVLCPKGSGLDKLSYKCLISEGGWQPCPKGGSLCTCADQPFCTSAKAYFGIEACHLFCSCYSSFKIGTCPTVANVTDPGYGYGGGKGSSSHPGKGSGSSSTKDPSSGYNGAPAKGSSATPAKGSAKAPSYANAADIFAAADAPAYKASPKPAAKYSPAPKPASPKPASPKPAYKASPRPATPTKH